MKNDQLRSTESSASTIEENEQPALAQTPTSTYPSAGKVVSSSGTMENYSLQADLTGIAGTEAGAQWDQILNENQQHLYSAFPYVWVKFNQDLPNGSSWSLQNASGTLVDSATIKDTGIREIKITFGTLPNGQPSLTGLSNFNLVLSDPTPGSFNAHQIDSTGGGLVIIANVEGDRDYYDNKNILVVKAEKEKSHFSDTGI